MCVTGAAIVGSTAFKVASLATSVVGTALSTYSSYRQSQAAEAQSKYQAAIAARNAELQRQNAADARERGKTEAAEHRDRIAQTIGASRAAMAARGLLVDDAPGTVSADLQNDLLDAGELDILRIKDNAEREARRYEIAASNYDASGSGHLMEASQQSPAGAAVGTFLAGAASSARLGMEVFG